MILQHYLELLRYYRRSVIRIVSTTMLVTAALSLLLLLANPKYTSEAHVVMLPSDAQIAFAHDMTVGIGAAQALAETHTEYLKSRPVAEAVLDRVSAEGLLVPAEKNGLAQALENVARTVVKTAVRIYRTANSGEYIELSERDIWLRDLQDGIVVEEVPNSYILRIEVTLRTPQASARATNMLAEAYMEVWKQQLDGSADRWSSFFDAQVAERQMVYDQLLEDEFALKRELGLLSIEEQREYLVKARETEREKHADALIQRRALDARLEQLQADSVQVTSGRTLARIEDELVMGEAEGRGLERAKGLRETLMADLSAALDATHSGDQELTKIAEKRRSVQAEIEDLRRRKLEVQLTRASALDQIRIVDPARVPRYPSSPEVVIYTAAGLIAGLLLAAFAIIALDTVAPWVRTSVDLERASGSHNALLLPPAGSSSRSRTRLAAAGESLERKLSLLGDSDTGRLKVTGFGNSTSVAAGAARLASMLPASGAPARDGEPGRDLALSPLAPVGSGFRWPDATAEAGTLVCLVPAGAVGDADIATFRERAREVGAGEPLFVLTDA